MHLIALESLAALQQQRQRAKALQAIQSVQITQYIAKGFFVQPSIQFIGSRTEFNDKHVVGLIDGGYTFVLDNNITISPKAGIGYRHTNFDGGSDSGVAYNVGVDVGFAKNWNAGLNYIRMKGENGHHADFTTLSIGYKF